GIEETALLLEGTNEEGQYLIAYYTSRETIDPDSLVNNLKEFLPEYMIPSVMIPMDTFPLTANGKVEFKKLPGAKEQYYNQHHQYVPASNAQDRMLIEIFEGVLNKTNIGIKDNFFQLGGHSLKAIRLVSDI